MPKFNTIQNNFQAGELSAKVFGRVDLPEYFRGCSRLENALVVPQGGASRRPGTRFMRELNSVASDLLAPMKGQILWRAEPTSNSDPSSSFSPNNPVYPSATDSLFRRGDFLYIADGNSAAFTGVAAKFSLSERRLVWASDLSSSSDHVGRGIFASPSGKVVVVRLSGAVHGFDANGGVLFVNTTDVPTTYGSCFGNDTTFFTLLGLNVQVRTFASPGVSATSTLANFHNKALIHGSDDLLKVYAATDNGSIVKFEYRPLISGDPPTIIISSVFSFTDPLGVAFVSLRYDPVTDRVFAATLSTVYCLNADTGDIIWSNLTPTDPHTISVADGICFVRTFGPIVRRYAPDGSFEDFSTDPHLTGGARPIEALDGGSFVMAHVPYLLDDDSAHRPELLAIRASGVRPQSVFQQFEKQVPFTSASGISYIICLKRKPLEEKLYDMSSQVAVFRASGEELAPVELLDFFYSVNASSVLVKRNILDIDKVQFAQSGDVLVMVDGNGPPIIFAWESELTFSAMGWGISAEYANSLSTTALISDFSDTSAAGRIFRDVAPFMRFPYQPRNASGAVKFRRRLYDSGELNFLQLLDSDDNSLLFLSGGTKNVVSRRAILGVFSGTEEIFPETLTMASVVPGSGSGTLDPAADTDNFRFSYWGGVPSGFLNFRNPDNNNWPKTVTFFEQRALFGGSSDFPDTLWFSAIGNFLHLMAERLLQDQGASSDVSGNNYFGDVAASDPFSFSLASTDASNVSWLMPSGNGLEVGTGSREFLATGGQGGVITNENLLVRAESHVGSDPVQPVRAGSMTFFVGRGGRELYSFIFDNDTQRMRPISVMSMSDGIVDHNLSLDDGEPPARIVELAYQKSLKIVWCRTSNGELLGLTSDMEHGTQAWHRFTLGRSEGERVKIKGMCVLPGLDGADELYLTTWRSLNGSTKVSIEKMGLPFDVDFLSNPSSALKDKPFFMDYSVRLVSASPRTTFTGLDRLEGRSVQILADGFEEPEQVVTGGEITLEDPASEVIVGIGYKSTIRLMPTESQGRFGDSTSELKRIHRLGLRFYRTWAASVSVDNFPDESLSIRSSNVSLGDPIPAFTGIRNIHPSTNPEKEHIVEVSSSRPLPMTLLAVTKTGETYG